MADIVKTLEGNKKVMYKFGESELDLNRYIHNLDKNLLGYMNSKNWNEGLRGEFIKTYDKHLAALKDLFANNTNRFSTTGYGSIIDTAGEFSNKDNDDIDPVGSEYYYDASGNRITTDDLNMLKLKKLKDYTTFSSNKEIASYFNKVGLALRSATSPSEPTKLNKFNLKNHGFLAKFNETYSPVGTDIDTSLFWDKDEVDPTTGKRGTANRANFLKEQIGNYITNLGEHDFADSSFKDRDTFLARLNAASDSLANGYNSESALALNQAGIGGEFLKKFFATSDLLIPEGMSREEYALRQEYEKLLKDNLVEEIRDIVEKPSKEAAANEALTNSRRLFEKLGINNWDKSSYILPTTTYDPNAIDTYRKAPINPMLPSMFKNYFNLKDLKTSATLSNNLDYYFNKNKDSLELDPVNLGAYIIPESLDESKGIIRSYNPSTRAIYTIPAYKTNYGKESWEKWYLKSLEKHTGGWSKKDGGVLKAQDGLSFAESVLQERLEQLRQYIRLQLLEATKADTKHNKPTKSIEDPNRDPYQAAAGNREIGTPTNPTGKWSTVDKARLAAAGADILSLVAAYVPVYGTAASLGLGLGSTFTNLGADIADESTSGWDVARNAAVGITSDVVGLIPGLGSAGKVGKIAKTLKYILPTAIAGWSAISNGGLYVLAANKLMSDPSKMTVDDWRSLGEGLLVTMGLGKLHAGNRQANKYASKNITTTTEKYATLRSKSGKDLRFTPEKAKQILLARGYKELNKAFLAEYPEESLHGEFSLKWLKSWSNPKVGKGVDYSKSKSNIDYSLLERIPWHYKGKDGKIVPRALTNNAFLNWLSSKSLWNGPNTLNWGTRKNPYYNKPLAEPAVEPEVRFTGSIKQSLRKELIRRRLINKKEDGGVINLANVRKFLNSGKITNTTSTANWFNDMYSSNPMKLWLGTFNKDNYNDFNNLLKSFFANKLITGYVPGATNTSKNLDVFNRLGLWEKTGTNITIDNLVKSGKIVTSGNSGDNAQGGHLDGYFGELEYLRHGGTKESWAGKDAELKLFLDEAAKKGLNYQLDNESGMYLLLPMDSTVASSTLSDKVVNNTTRVDVEGEKKLPDSTPKNGVLSGIFNNPTMTHGLPRAMYASRMNRKMTDMAKDSITPLLKDPMQINRITRGDLDAEVRGLKTYASLRNMASKPISSDVNILLAMQLEAELKGLEAINAGLALSNQVLRQYDEMAWQQGKENTSNRHETAMYNRALQWAVNLDKSRMDLAYLLKLHEIWDVLGQQVEKDARTKLLENKLKADTFATIDIKNAVAGDPNLFGAKLTEDELVLWDKFQSGVNPSTGFDNDERRKLSLIQLKISTAEQNLLQEHYGIPASNWSGASKRLGSYNMKIDKKGGVISAKKGTRIAGIEAKTADAERFLRLIKEIVDRNEKSLERLSKSLYGIIKSSTIK